VKKYHSFGILFLAMLAVGWSSIFIRLCEGLDPFLIAFYRMAWAALILLPFTLSHFRKTFSGISCKDLLMMLSVGVILALHFITWTSSLFYTTVASSTVLVTTQPIFLVLLSTLFTSEKVRRLSIIAVAIAMGGAIVIAWGGFEIGGDHLKGDLLALAGAVCAAFNLFFGRAVRQRVNNLAYIQIVYASSAAVLLIILLIYSELRINFSISIHFWLLLLALIPTIIGHSLYNWSLKKIRSYIVGTSVLGEPIGASIYAWLLFDEIPRVSTIFGAVLIFGGVALLFYNERKNIT